MALTIAQAIAAGNLGLIGQALTTWLSQISSAISGNAQIQNVQITLVLPNGSQINLAFNTTITATPMSLADTQTILNDFQTIFNNDLTNINTALAGD